MRHLNRLVMIGLSANHPNIAEALAIGISYDYQGETVKIFAVLQPGAKATEQEIVDFCKAKMTACKVPRILEFRDTVPRSAVGKIKEILKGCKGRDALVCVTLRH